VWAFCAAVAADSGMRAPSENCREFYSRQKRNGRHRAARLRQPLSFLRNAEEIGERDEAQGARSAGTGVYG